MTPASPIQRPEPAPVLFENARLIDPASGRDELGSLLVEDGLIAALGPKLAAKSTPAGVATINCMGHVLCPGLIDMLVYVGEPGREHRETLASASMAAASGGVTTIITMPNANPVIDDIALVDFIERRARDTSIVHVRPMAALTKALNGRQITEIGLLQQAGAVAFSDGGYTIKKSRLLRRALEYAGQFDAVLSVQAEDPDLAKGGVMNEGEVATRLGLTGIPAAAEAIVIDRNLRLVELTGSKLHFAKLSARLGVEAIRNGKARGLPVTCGVAAASLVLNENDIGSYRTFVKLSPPLRTEDDRLALVEGIKDGTIDILVSSHNPQSADTKRHPFAEAAAGAIGLETLLPAALSLHHNGDVPLVRLLETMTSAPADLLGLDAGHLEPGASADVSLIDLELPWQVKLDQIKSKSKNTPFEDHRMQGRCIQTMVSGHTVYEYQSAK